MFISLFKDYDLKRKFSIAPVIIPKQKKTPVELKVENSETVDVPNLVENGKQETEEVQAVEKELALKEEEEEDVELI